MFYLIRVYFNATPLKMVVSRDFQTSKSEELTSDV